MKKLIFVIVTTIIVLLVSGLLLVLLSSKQTGLSAPMVGYILLNSKPSNYLFIAALKFDSPFLCRFIKDELNSAICYSVFPELHQDVELCDKSGVFKEECYFDMAINRSDASICSNIDAWDVKEECFYKIGIALQDEDTCAGLDFGPSKNRCYILVFRETKDINICSKIPGGPPNSRNTCFRESGALMAEQSFCDKFSDFDKVSCLQGVFSVKPSLEICNKISYVRNRDICIREFAVINQDELICDKISDSSIKNFCYRDLAVIKKDIKICNSISNNNGIEVCNKRVLNK